MSKVPRRAKMAECLPVKISPLTYKEMREYGEMSLKFAEQKADLLNLSKEQQDELRAITFHVIVCGLNGADPSLSVSAVDLDGEIDDVTAGDLFREIMEMGGYKVPSREEVEKKLAPTPGEVPASS